MLEVTPFGVASHRLNRLAQVTKLLHVNNLSENKFQLVPCFLTMTLMMMSNLSYGDTTQQYWKLVAGCTLQLGYVILKNAQQTPAQFLW